MKLENLKLINKNRQSHRIQGIRSLQANRFFKRLISFSRTLTTGIR